ncbi:cytochrome ubiquinol oxidase subunit I [Pseudorhodobacter sp.]|uniref:cytochrome ubiquinol oxidase subunit I n=1 Tax=Pseudorhodobacter sp. TaxID=1934400 RepID=UPI002AFECE48|nr:cytochrome ubiquinol oxidase subunit I [Pseudorhodobacter sp.]
MTTLDLSRLQFAFTISAHIIFPAFSIGLASWLAVLNGLWLWWRQPHFLALFERWKIIFALVFAMGTVSGVVMSFQFGTNWSVFSDKTGPIIGPLMGYEVMSAFFLEAGFLGIMLFGRARVGPAIHMLATLIVASGTLFSAFWIISANSWMQTPAGFAINTAGQFVPVDWWAVVFNPSFPYRLVHMVLAAYLTTAFVVGACGAWHLLQGRTDPCPKTMFSMAMWMALFIAPLQIIAGDQHGLNTLAHQPAKIAAMEGHFESYPEGHAPLVLFGIPDMEAGVLRHPIAIPDLGSLILTHDLGTPLVGLDAVPKADWPDMAIIFWSFRLMVAVGIAMAFIGICSGYLRWRGRLYDSAWFHRLAFAMGPAGFAAVLAGWVTTEAGRQPFTVYGVLRTADSASPLQAPIVGASLLAYFLVYLVVFGAGSLYALRLMAQPMTDPSQPQAVQNV